MTTLTINNRTFLAIMVPEHSQNHKVIMNYLWFTLGSIVETDEVELPPGTYSELFLLSQVDEERAAGIVEETYKYDEEENPRESTGYRLYDADESVCDKVDTAIESFHSWLRANGVMTENPMGETEPDEVIMMPTHRTVPICCRSFDKYGGCCNNPDPEQVEDYTPEQNGEWAEWHHHQSQVSKEWIFVEQLKPC